MDTAPEVPKCCGVMPPRIATYFISIFGLASGGLAISSIVMYGLVEDSALAHFFRENPIDEAVKKFVLLSFGINSLLLFVGNALLFIGIALKQERSLLIGAWVIFGMCMLVIILAIGAPGTCFFVEELCVIKLMSTGAFTLGYIFVTVFLWFWLYFMVVVFNHLNEIL